MEITEPLILSDGSHDANSGRGCAMEVLSWSMGMKFTDLPECSDQWLATLVQQFNDSVAHYRGVEVIDDITRHMELQPEDAIRAFDLAVATVGTALPRGKTRQPMQIWSEALKREGRIQWHDPRDHLRMLIRGGEVNRAERMIYHAIEIFRERYAADLDRGRPVTPPTAEQVDAALIGIREGVSAV